MVRGMSTEDRVEYEAWLGTLDGPAAGECPACKQDWRECVCAGPVPWQAQRAQAWCGIAGHDWNCDCDLDSVPF